VQETRRCKATDAVVAVKHESRIAVGAFDGHAVEGGVIIREEGIEFESEVAEACAVGLL
jgi:hypothetical protein